MLSGCVWYLSTTETTSSYTSRHIPAISGYFQESTNVPINLRLFFSFFVSLNVKEISVKINFKLSVQYFSLDTILQKVPYKRRTHICSGKMFTAGVNFSTLILQKVCCWKLEFFSKFSQCLLPRPVENFCTSSRIIVKTYFSGYCCLILITRYKGSLEVSVQSFITPNKKATRSG